ncbi:type IV pilin protein [Stutzerimonas balearica]|jgi:type IV pilus assembly protein PilA|uniref:type IV pilin protein n=1 Tax=Stutzerimonas balearica TaxID=74829 RepID=UPI001BC9E377|nr:prepilin-type N-terminal cleavage/methylation domain-containing protein [Stutzerimonas balearica]MBS4148358.1 prepilin-type N-terminal cleavage/methylation domain-containing protein [Stutzerimonas balearica]
MKLRSQAFTLVELMLTLAILGILITLTIPQFREYRARSNDAVAMTDTRNCAMLFATNLIR